MSNSIVYQVELPNQLLLTIEDQSHRYFGDYHRVRLRVRCLIPVTATAFSASDDPAAAASAAIRMLGDKICYEKTLEQMGVSGSRLEATRQALIEKFLQANQPYLARADFAAHFIAMKIRNISASAQPGGARY